MEYNKSKRYGLSGSILAKETCSMVLPISHNSGKYWKRRGLVKKKGLISFVIGEAFSTNNMSLDEINKTAREWIDENVIV